MKEPSQSFEKDQKEREYAEACALAPDKLAKMLNTDLKEGLSSAEAEERLRTYGLNMIPKIKPSLFKVWIAPFLNLLITIYLVISTALAVIAFFILPSAGARLTIWFPMIIANAALSMLQQARAQKKLSALQQLSAPKCDVIRDGKLCKISSEQVVPGDVVKLDRGDKVPADARVISASSLRLNEAALTGESDEIEKFENDTKCDENTPLYARKNMVFLGTYVTAGSSHVLVTKTGRETQIGRISTTLEELETGEIPLVQKVNKLAKFLGLAVLIYLSFSLAFNLIYLYSGEELFPGGLLNVPLLAETLVRNLITAMSIMPINIPLLTTIILLTGILTMSAHQVVIRDLTAVESLGRVSVVCSDKTGTITKNEMTVKWICFPSASGRDPTYGVTGVGFEPSGKIIEVDSNSHLEDLLARGPDALDGTRVSVEPETSLEYVLMSGMLDNDSEIVKENLKMAGKDRTAYKASGNVTDASLIALFRKSELSEKMYRSRFEEVRSYPFDSKLKFSARIYKDKKASKHIIFTKGATEVLLPRCDFIAQNNVADVERISDKDKSRVSKKANLFASSGYRVISFAYKWIDKLPSGIKTDRECSENDNLTYLGFIAIMDPPREGVRESVAEAREAGIRPVMVTGDSLATAKSIAQEVGITEKDDLAVEGSKIASLSDKEFLKASVFARVSPEHKMSIVDRYKRHHRVVAMTGDGVNDALAISKADVGISTGITGTDVAKQAADMVITDDSFNSIITGIREGRGLFQKIRLIVFFYIAVNLAEALIYFGASMIPGFYLLNPWQQIYIFSTAHTIPPLAIIIGHLSRYVMKEKPRDTEGIMNKHLGIALFIFSISLAVMFYLAYFGTLNGLIPVFSENTSTSVVSVGSVPGNPYNPVDWLQAKARTMLYSVAIVAECPLILSISRMYKPRTRIPEDKSNRWRLWPFVLLIPVAHLALMYVPSLQSLMVHFLGANFEIVPFTLFDWLIVLGVGLVPIALLETYIAWVRRRGLSF